MGRSPWGVQEFQEGSLAAPRFRQLQSLSLQVKGLVVLELILQQHYSRRFSAPGFYQVFFTPFLVQQVVFSTCVEHQVFLPGLCSSLCRGQDAPGHTLPFRRLRRAPAVHVVQIAHEEPGEGRPGGMDDGRPWHGAEFSLHTSCVDREPRPPSSIF